MPCEAILCWGGLGLAGHCGVARPPPFQKAGAGPVLAPPSGLQSLAALRGCLAFWGLGMAPGTTALCLVSLLSPSLQLAVLAAHSAGDTLPASPPLTSCFHSFLSGFKPLFSLFVSLSPHSFMRDAHEACLGIFPSCCLFASCT